MVRDAEAALHQIAPNQKGRGALWSLSPLGTEAQSNDLVPIASRRGMQSQGWSEAHLFEGIGDDGGEGVALGLGCGRRGFGGRWDEWEDGGWGARDAVLLSLFFHHAAQRLGGWNAKTFPSRQARLQVSLKRGGQGPISPTGAKAPIIKIFHIIRVSLTFV